MPVRVQYPVEDSSDEIVNLSDESKVRHKSKGWKGGANDSRRNSTLLGASVLEGIQEEDEEFNAATQLADNKVTTGKDVFGFRTPKKSDSMVRKALEEVNRTPKSGVTGKTPNSKSGTPRGQKTPINFGTPTRGSKVQVTPSRTGSGKKRMMQAATPLSARKRVRKTLNRQSDSIERDKYSDSESNESESSSDEEDTENKPIIGPPATPRTPARKGRAARRVAGAAINAGNMADSYFEAQHCRVVTSDKTLSKQNLPRLTEEEVNKLLDKWKQRYQTEIFEMKEDNKTYFTKWLSLLHRGYNIVTYGLGSKKSLLQEFREAYFVNSDCLVVNGYFPSLTVKSILNGISDDILDIEGSFSSTNEQIQAIHAAVEDDIYVIVHNIDGPMLRNDKAQSCLAQLVNHPQMHLICSIDHINAPLIWDQFKLANYNFIWFDCTTFVPYKEEAAGESVMVKATGGLQLASITHVLAALTPNAKRIFMVLAKHQIEHQDSQYVGIAFMQLYTYCRNDFLVTSDLELKAQLTEFRDHKLISSKRGSDGAEYLIIPIDKPTLDAFIQTLQI